MMCRCNECANRYGGTYRDTGDGPKYEVYCRLDQARGRYILRDEYAQHECKGFESRGEAV